ncbi:MAG TPA: hypothetical protein VGR96_17880 [Acidobacteriaceae bacterium]|nr:hypothetical protein [Acidobacteriaceae bacterium]
MAIARWMRWRPLLMLALLAAAIGSSYARPARTSSWRSATEPELRSLIPARAPVVGERIETEFRTASGITDGNGRFIAGVVLITAGYSAEGKYSHYFLSQVPLKLGEAALPPGQYLIGWTRGEDTLNVTFYQAQNGKPVAQVDAVRNPSVTRVEQFRIWPPNDRSMIQFGRFTFHYSVAAN